MISFLALTVIFLALLSLTIFIYGKVEDQPFKINDPLPLPEDDQLVSVIFGATGSSGIGAMKEMAKRNNVIIAASRRHSKWGDIVKKNPELKGKVQWIKCDVRLHRDVDRVLSEVKKTYGRIDVAVNMAVINGDDNLLKTPISTGKDGNDIYLKLPGAYKYNYKGRLPLYKKGAPGTEHSFFTNFIGLSNLIRSEHKHNVQILVNPKNVSPLCDTLTDELQKEMLESHIVTKSHLRPTVKVISADFANDDIIELVDKIEDLFKLETPVKFSRPKVSNI